MTLFCTLCENNQKHLVVLHFVLRARPVRDRELER